MLPPCVQHVFCAHRLGFLLLLPLSPFPLTRPPLSLHVPAPNTWGGRGHFYCCVRAMLFLWLILRTEKLGLFFSFFFSFADV